MIACDDPELFAWLDRAAAVGGSFVKTIAMAGLRADAENYALLRPVLLEFKAKYPKYASKKAPGAAVSDAFDIERVAIVEEDRQMILLSLALCTLLRPGFYYACGEIADRFQGREMFEKCRTFNADVVKPQENLR